MYDRVFIIAEAGVNHNGKLAIAKELANAAAKSGADAVKFQTFKAEHVVTPGTDRAEYQKENMSHKNESQLSMIKNLELSAEDFLDLKTYCDHLGIMFLSSPFDSESIDLLDKMPVQWFKIPSGELVNLPFLREIGRRKRPILLSTGMAALGEVENAIDVLRSAGVEEIVLLHCTSNYPTLPTEVNLRAMVTLREAFALPVGYSDHTLGFAVPVAAVALGAVVIEKHLTLDRRMEGPDHKASLSPEQFSDMVGAIRMVEESLGDGRKRPTASELEVMKVARRSLVSTRDICCGEVISCDNIAAKRPGTGISPMYWDTVVGRRAQQNIPKHTILTWGMI